jgi:hypothetical protein
MPAAGCDIGLHPKGCPQTVWLLLLLLKPAMQHQGSILSQHAPLLCCTDKPLTCLSLQPALATFGYQKGELEGKNVTTLMPPPFSTRHHQYLQAYHATGHGVIINQVRELVALHKVSHSPA